MSGMFASALHTRSGASPGALSVEEAAERSALPDDACVITTIGDEG